MRLTLRTMLCYLDDVLEPADAEELGAKIEESEYASNVVHRLRTSMRRLRLGAPALEGPEMGFDPNTVADYLDNTLPPEKVPDFERVCLESSSETCLAEVASCHHILTLVLGEPAEVPPAMRERIYGLGRLDEQQLQNAAIAAPPVTEDAAGTQHHVDAPQPARTQSARTQRDKPKVPEYLKTDHQTNRLPMVAAVAFLLLIGAAALAIWQPWNPGPVAVNSPGDGTADGESLFDVEEGIAPVLPSNKPAIDNGEANAGGQSPATTNNDQPATGGAADIIPGGAGAVKTPLDDTGEFPDGDSAAPPTGDPFATDTGDRPPATGGPDLVKPTGEPDAVASIDPPIDPATPAGDTGTELPLVDKVVGHFISTGQALAGWDNEAAVWKRLSPRAALKPGDKFRSLSTYRPQLLLANKVQVTFAGEASAQIANPLDGVPRIEMPYGQALFATMGETGNQIIIQAGDRTAAITFANVDAAVAVGVYRFHSPGADPLASLAHQEVIATVTGGQIQWRQDDAEPVTLDVGQQLTVLDNGLAAVRSTESQPKWVKANDVIDIDRLASATLEPMLDDTRPLEIALEERSEHPRVEVRSLAARCLGAIGKFERLVDSFNDESLKSYWSEHYDALQRAMARDADVAQRVRGAIERRKGEQAERVYRMLWGYNPAQLSSGSDKILVDYLKHDSLDVRVLAINNLRRITARTHGYHPHLPELRRRTAQRQWDEGAASNSIEYLTPPPELPPREKGS